jgi:TrmH family RNA methyltransferase
VEGLFLAEGLRIMAEARDSGVLPEIVACAEGELHPLAAEIVAEAEAPGPRRSWCRTRSWPR